MQINDRFTRARWLFGDNFEKLSKAKVLVCGCGGVGGVCIDALYRSGVVNLTVIDCDKFDITNQNRQIGSQFVGELKADVFTRLYPGILGLNLKLTKEIVEEFDFSKFDVVIDCIDDVPAKVEIAKKCHKKLLSSMGGAKRLDPTRIQVASIWKTTNDPFARKIRYELKKAGFKNDYKVVFSTEMPNCKDLGSFIGVTASFGLNLASLCVQKITHA
ncbi:tRNA threonylcarbamoyladenosine dehydratase [Campylobacter fetus]|uniref:tRNA threonylcarbamoyladenosine dehydratase n=3 Tax=Campylobacter fetus TaxID=196 RepID=A0A5L8J8I3_CAMFE|nr:MULTISPECIES: tRNA threonylcarbamoyladenosine dehydratase [Campylobacter]OCS23023.1 tRNA cyclic N6-threonylcarbamoyladenosine(37) synthase TcdA [Campylobacter fetus subsp. venerealis cfvi97/532]OCS27218.1 tRNA cyclic N6-threonylcarbamoyladenosine(37) synthase TcdA [Campylobacter fetus subsp. venerealis cfvB10]OCS32358.1 tRNA cyclic N6-threonylcarbamoyladenosine(37) synthase TcdA [Campylobacter fetus subsp. venerealis LMG 6570 = CCUG 33900]OCS41781.1 tRNA cyclic N6-threonylcarbamoyladenosine(